MAKKLYGLPSSRLAGAKKSLATPLTTSPSGHLTTSPSGHLAINCQSLFEDVLVYSCANDIDIAAFSSFQVDAKCQEKIHAMKRDKDKLNTLLGRYLLHYAMQDERYLDILYQPKGKPYLPGCYFNISHCDTQVVLAVSLTKEIGIDIEDTSLIHLPDCKQCFGEQEWHYITSAADPYYAFYRLWTRKEALLKATGQGLIDNLHKLSVLKDVVNLQDKEWRLFDSCEGGRVFSCAVMES